MGALSDEGNLASLKWLPQIEDVLSAGVFQSGNGLSPLLTTATRRWRLALIPFALASPGR